MTANNSYKFAENPKNSMAALKIGVVEDEAVIAENIASMLRELGYQVPEPAYNYSEAIVLLTRHKPDLLLLDIRLNDHKDGIELAERINSEYGIPFIFLTANADRATVQRAKTTEPAAYLIKPFTKNDLYASIEVAAMRHQLHGSEKGQEKTIFLKDGNVMRKFALHEIVSLEADHVYINVFTQQNKYLIRSSMQNMLEQLNDVRFFQTHRSFTVNLHYVDGIANNAVIIAGKEIPVSKANYNELVKRLKEV